MKFEVLTLSSNYSDGGGNYFVFYSRLRPHGVNLEDIFSLGFRKIYEVFQNFKTRQNFVKKSVPVPIYPSPNHPKERDGVCIHFPPNLYHTYYITYGPITNLKVNSSKTVTFTVILV